MGHVNLSIILGTYNRLPLLKRCLNALSSGVHVDHEIFVIDGGSTDGTLEYLEQYPGICLVKDDGLIGQAKSLNQVLGSIDSDFVCWLSDDNLVADGMLDVAVDVLNTDTRVGMVSLKVKDVTGLHTKDPYLGAIWESGVLNCNQGMLPTELLRQLGGFNEEFRDYGIDIDLTTRVLLSGFRVVYTKKIAVYHYRDHETDNWITKTNRENRLQLARELYRSNYAKLILGENELAGTWFANPKSLGMNFPLFLCEKMIKHYKIILRFLLKILMNGAIVGPWVSSFFRDCYNVFFGRFISRWDLVKNFRHPYYLVQQIPEALRLNAQVIENQNQEMDKNYG